MKKILIVGTNTTASHVFSFITMYHLYDVIGFAVDKEYRGGTSFMGLPVYNTEDIETVLDKKNDFIFIAILWNRLNLDRKNVYEKLKNKGFKFANLISPTAIIRGEIKGDNCWIHDYVVIQNNTIIKSNVLIMSYVLIGADTIISSNCFIGAKALVAGGCVVGNQTFVGMNATIFDGRTVGNKCIVGACSAVKRNMPDFCTIKVNNDANCIIQRTEAEIESKLMFSKNVK
ncbi:MAG: hypothetical protein WC140_04835 [Bacteroidales bacterium]